MSRWQEEKRMVLAAARDMVAKGLAVGTGGNVSLRLADTNGRELLAITPSSRYYDELEAEDIQVVDFAMKPVEGALPPSMETALHAAIYRAREEINAVIHTHSVFASALSVAGLSVPAILDDQVVFIGRRIDLAAHSPDQGQRTESVLAALKDSNAVLLANHGMLGVGRSMREAFTVCELAERAAMIYWLALSTGKVETI